MNRLRWLLIKLLIGKWQVAVNLVFRDGYLMIKDNTHIEGCSFYGEGLKIRGWNDGRATSCKTR